MIKRKVTPKHWLSCLEAAQTAYGIKIQIDYYEGMFPLLKQCGTLQADDMRKFASYLRLPASAEDEIAKEIKTKIPFDDTLPQAFSILVAAGMKAVNKILTALLPLFTNHYNFADKHFKMIACFDCIDDEEIRKKSIGAFLREGRVWDSIFALRSEYGKTLFAYLVPKYLETCSGPKISSELKIHENAIQPILTVWKQSSKPYSDTIYQLIKACGDYSCLKVVVKDPTNVLVKDIVQRAIDDQDLQIAQGDNVLDWFCQILPFVPEKKRPLLAAMFIKNGAIIREMEKLSSGVPLSRLPSFKLLLENMQEPQVTQILSSLKQGLLLTAKDQWQEAFKNPVNIIDFFKFLKKKNCFIFFKNSFCDVFKQWLSTVFAGKGAEGSLGAEDISVFFDFLDKDFQEDVRVWINHLAREKSFSLSDIEAKLVLELSAHDKWTEADGECLCQAIQNAVTNKNKNELVRLVPILETGLRQFKPSSRFSSTLKEPVETWLKTNSTACPEILKRLCAALNIKLDPAYDIDRNKQA